MKSTNAAHRCKAFCCALFTVLVFLWNFAPTVHAANVSTVATIPQDISAALDYADNNVGLNSGEYTIPGLMQTVTRNSAGDTVQLCTGMVPQGMCFADGGNYLLISAYCNCGSGHRSVIYVINASSKAYETTLILDNCAHVGGIAAYGDYIWVCDTASGKYLRSYKLSSMKDALTHNYWTVYTQSQPAVATSPSFLCCANGYLYLGTFYETTTTCVIYYYSVSGTSISKQGSFTVTGIPKIQGISVRGEYMVLSCSYGRKNASDVYIFHDAANQFKKSGVTYAKASAKHYSFPNMVEACYIGSTYTYFLFESGAKTYRESTGTRPLDKYLRFKSTDLFAGTLAKPEPEPVVPADPDAFTPNDGVSGITVENSRLNGFEAGTTVTDMVGSFKSNIAVLAADGASLDANATVGTGCIVRNKFSDGTYVDAVAIITGDTTGDGVVSTNDYIALVAMIKASSDTNSVYYIAGDCNYDKVTNSGDYIALKTKLSG